MEQEKEATLKELKLYVLGCSPRRSPPRLSLGSTTMSSNESISRKFRAEELCDRQMGVDR